VASLTVPGGQDVAKRGRFKSRQVHVELEAAELAPTWQAAAQLAELEAGARKEELRGGQEKMPGRKPKRRTIMSAENPYRAVGYAFGIGAVMGLLLRHRRRDND